MLNFKKIIAAGVAVLSIVSMSVFAFAVEPQKNSALTSEQVKPIVQYDKQVTVPIGKDFSTIMSDDNWLDVVLKVVNDIHNPSDVTFRIVNGKGLPVGGEQTVAPGGQANLKIPSTSGKYSLEGKVAEGGIVANYSFNISDHKN
jgi:hypothetical protein